VDDRREVEREDSEVISAKSYDLEVYDGKNTIREHEECRVSLTRSQLHELAFNCKFLLQLQREPKSTAVGPRANGDAGKLRYGDLSEKVLSKQTARGPPFQAWNGTTETFIIDGNPAFDGQIHHHEILDSHVEAPEICRSNLRVSILDD
jgi:hypothetical protein